MKVIAVKFKESIDSKVYTSKEYYYKSNYLVDTGEEVVVYTPDRGLQIAIVVWADVSNPFLKELATDWIVQVIKLDTYKILSDSDKKLAIIEKELDNRISKLQKKALYKKFAQEDEEIADLLYEYEKENKIIDNRTP